MASVVSVAEKNVHILINFLGIELISLQPTTMSFFFKETIKVIQNFNCME